MEVVHEDGGGEGSMQCPNHPYKNSTPGGICAFCLQEKLGKLVSSSYAAAVFPSSSSSSPSFRSTYAAAAASSAASESGGGDCGHHSRKSRLPFVSTHKKKKHNKEENMVFKRSKSTATPRRGLRFFDEKYVEDYSPNRRRFWSFLHLSKHPTSRKSEKQVKNLNFSSHCNVGSSRERKREDFMVVDESEATFDNRKVSRSRSVGCGSRSFSGDFFERISTGFGDCTLRRVESQREGKLKMRSLGGERGEDCTRQRERVKCGGIFGGFALSSSSSSSSSNLQIASSSDGGKSFGHQSHGRSKSWGWAFASPMRAFGKNSSAGKRNASSTKNAAPNLAAIPSLLAVGG